MKERGKEPSEEAHQPQISEPNTSANERSTESHGAGVEREQLHPPSDEQVALAAERERSPPRRTEGARENDWLPRQRELRPDVFRQLGYLVYQQLCEPGHRGLGDLMVSEGLTVEGVDWMELPARHWLKGFARLHRLDEPLLERWMEMAGLEIAGRVLPLLKKEQARGTTWVSAGEQEAWGSPMQQALRVAEEGLDAPFYCHLRLSAINDEL